MGRVLVSMGCNAGWLTAAAALFQSSMPSEHLVYLSERQLDTDRFLDDVQKAFAKGRGLLGRASMEHLSKPDSEEAYQAGACAVRYAVEGINGYMVGMDAVRTPSYSVSMTRVPLAVAANTERVFPPDWITPGGNGVSEAFLSYLAPLVDTSAPRYAWFAGR